MFVGKIHLPCTILAQVILILLPALDLCQVDGGDVFLALLAKDHDGLSHESKIKSIELYICSQDRYSKAAGIKPSACIDGILLEKLHPKHEPVSTKKDKSQRKECRCTESVDIGSYKQSCPHACVYCYASSI